LGVGGVARVEIGGVGFDDEDEVGGIVGEWEQDERMREKRKARRA